MTNALWQYNQRYWPYLVCVGLLLVTYLSLKAPYEGPTVIPGIDKVKHFLAWAVIALPIVCARAKLTLHWLVLLVLYSAVLEVVQPYFSRRMDLFDLAANICGIYSVQVLSVFYRKSVAQ